MVFPFGARRPSITRSKSLDRLTAPLDTARSANVLLVGQIYLDTILDVDHFPAEDHKLRATRMEQRRGGNVGNTAEVLAQFSRVSVYCMSALGPKDSSRQLIAQLEAKGIKTSTCVFRKSPTPSSYIIQSKATASRTIISATSIEDITRDEFARKFEMTSIAKTMAFDFDANAPFQWIHWEGRNVDHAAQQIDWIDAKARREGWRSGLTISVELEKPDREHIDSLMSKGDVLFFSKLFAERRGYHHPGDFLRATQPRCKANAVLYCTWGAYGATCLRPNGEQFHAAAPTVSRVTDSVGAGDTFVAGIISTLLRAMPYPQSLKFASELASRKVAQQGFDGLADAMVSDKSLHLPVPPPPRSSSMIRKYSDSDVRQARDLSDYFDEDDASFINDRFSGLTFSSSKPLFK